MDEELTSVEKEAESHARAVDADSAPKRPISDR